MPPEGQNVTVVLADGSERLAYWQDGAWWAGLDESSTDERLEGVEFWRWDN